VPDGDLFLDTDGVTPFLDGDEVYENVFLARAAWEESRVVSWEHPFRVIWPPKGAVVYDGITELTQRQHPTRRGQEWRLAEMRKAVEADIASVETFRREHPTEAAEISGSLNDYVGDLRYLLALAQQLGRTRNESGYVPALTHAWGTYEVRRR